MPADSPPAWTDLDPATPLSKASARRLALSALSSAQLGVVGRAQLTTAGWSSSALSRAANDGRLDRLLRGVYVPAGSTPPSGTRLKQAMLTAPPEATISHALALEAVGALRVDPERLLEYVVMTKGKPRDQPGVLAHRTRWLPDTDITVIDGFPVTVFERSLYDLAARSSRDWLQRQLDEAVRTGLLDFRALYRVLEERKRLAGRPKLLEAIAGLGRSMGRARSEFERTAVRLCVERGMDEPVLNGIVGGFEVDLHQTWSRGIVELDGFRFHSSPDDVARNANRRAALIDLGFPIMTVTWFDVSQRPDRTAARIEAFFERHRIP